MTTENKPVAKLNLQQTADMWFLRFGYDWVLNTKVEEPEWKKIVEKLMRSSLLEYHLIHDKTGIQEVYRLKESYANH